MYYLLIAITMMNQGRRDAANLVFNTFSTYTRGSQGCRFSSILLYYLGSFTILFGLFFTR